ncbi:MAG: lipoyl synthase [Chloroflexi bacterium]|nr:lipoyl synthase [Chloroflexota bacterium]
MSTDSADTKPRWLVKRAPSQKAMQIVVSLLGQMRLATICEEANCPNIGDCFSEGTATFLILGRTCTRNCRFCNVKHGQGEPLDTTEPARLVAAARHLRLRHVVLTSVTRDDLPDGGASAFAACIQALHEELGVTVEALVPDFRGDETALATVMAAAPEVLGHNVETVPSLYSKVRPQADYQRSLRLLKVARTLKPGGLTKSGLMVGLGESRDEVIAVMRDLRAVGCDLLTIGQYLRPSATHYPVAEYVHPDTFAFYQQQAEAMGFLGVLSGPFVRSSFHAQALYQRGQAQ